MSVIHLVIQSYGGVWRVFIIRRRKSGDLKWSSVRKFIGIATQAFRASGWLFGQTLRGWLAEALELVTSRTTFPYKSYQMKPVNFDGMVLLYIIGLMRLKVVIIKLYFICFYFF